VAIVWKVARLGEGEEYVDDAGRVPNVDGDCSVLVLDGCLIYEYQSQGII
jgi:hypothetical protein